MMKFSNLALGFRKVDTDRWEFANEGFLRGQKHLLKTIRRRRAPSHPPLPEQQSSSQFIEIGQFGFDGEIDSLRRDKSVLMTELVKLRQEQQNTRAHLKELEKRLQGTEQKQQLMMTFLARAMRNPEFLHQLAQQKKSQELEDAIFKKRRRSIEQGSYYGDEGASSSSSSREFETMVNIEAPELHDFYGYQVNELESLALEIQGFGNRESGGEHDNLGGGKTEGEMNDVFWEELLSESIDGETGASDVEGNDDKDLIVLAEKLGYLKSTSPS